MNSDKLTGDMPQIVQLHLFFQVSQLALAFVEKQ